MPDPKTLDPAKEIQDMMIAAKKSPHYFVMMKSKDGVAIEAHKTKKPESLIPGCKAKGGMSGFMVSGVMTADAKFFYMQSAVDDVPASLPRLARKYFKEIGVKARVEITLPGGGKLGDGEEGDETGTGDETARQEDMVETVTEPEAGPDPRADLTARLKTLVPQVKAAVDQSLAGAEKLATAIKAAAGEIASGGVDRAGALLDAIEKGLANLGTSASADPDKLRAELQREFDGLSANLQKVLQEGTGPGIAKVKAVAQMFTTELAGDLKKAGQALTVLKQLVTAELAKLTPATQGGPGPMDRLGEAVGGAFDKLKEMAEGVTAQVSEKVEEVKQTIGDIAQTVTDAVGDGLESLATEAGLQDELAMLRKLGVPRDERAKLLEEWKADPAKIKAYEKKLMDDAKVPEDRRASLEKLREDNPVAFAASLTTLGEIGDTDTSPAALQKALEDAEAARNALTAKTAALAKAQEALATATGTTQAATQVTAQAQQNAQAAAAAVADLISRIGDPTKLTPEQRRQFDTERVAVINANENAKKALAAAQAAEKKAREDEAAAKAKADTATTERDLAKGVVDQTAAAQEKGEARKGLLDAIQFGPLSPDAKPKLADADKAALAGVYAKDSGLARQAGDLLRDAKDPGALARGAASVAGKFADGFADQNGNKLDLPEDQRREMAANALRMGAARGEDYFTGFDEYMKSGKQLQPDPYGGMSAPLSGDDETQRKNAIALGRSRGMAAAAVKPDGTVDFDSPEAKGAMDHMLFHPGSLNSYTPQMTAKMEETQKLFSDPATKDQANDTIRDTNLPPVGEAHRDAALTLVAGTTGKDKGAVTDTDAKAAVLGAMMTPLSQGPVGSCFSTAPVRAIRETDPLRAMGEYSKIASTGEYTANDGSSYPANTNLPKGENPLMRSWEYSVATAAAEETASIERNNLRGGLFDAGGPGKSLKDIKAIVGDAAWNNTVDPVKGIVPGVGQKLRTAVATELKFEYNAGPPVGGPTGGGGDGRSTDGGYEIRYKGTALKSEAEFTDAIKSIALEASGFAEGTTEGDEIVALVTSQDFIDSVKARGGATDYLPWELPGGGFEWQTRKALDGGAPDLFDMAPANVGPPPPTEAERTEAVIKGLLDKHGAMPTDLSLISTRGTDANHAFNALPNHPSMDKIRDPDRDQKINDELIQPGRDIAAKKLPVAQAVRMYEDQLKAFMKGRPTEDRALIIDALKRRPTVEMTPGELKKKVTDELAAWRDDSARRRLDVWFTEENARLKADSQPEMAPGEKAGYLQWFKDDNEAELKKQMDTRLIKELAPPEVVLADSNWGGPEGQVYFVAAPDPSTGELKIWEKTMPAGTMTPLGKNWAEANWYEIH